MSGLGYDKRGGTLLQINHVSKLDAEIIDPHGIVEIVLEFDQGEEVIVPKLNEVFCSYDLHEAANYVQFTANHIQMGRDG